MSRQDPHWIGWLERIYASALRLYPRRFRREWEQPMRQAFRDRCREVANGERSPLRLATELLPDLATGVAREQVLTLEETTMLRRNVMFALLLAIVATLVFFDRIDSTLAIGMQDARHWWVQREQRADNAALAQYRTALADAVVAEAKTPRDHAVAGLLYANGGVLFKQGAAFQQVMQVGTPEAIAARMQLAQKQWDRAVMGGDPLALWLSAVDCPVRHCDGASALHRLQQQQPDNAAVTFLAIDQALAQGNDVDLRDALDRIGDATHYDDYNGALLQALLSTDGKAPLPWRLRSVFPGNAQAAETLLSQGLWSMKSQGTFQRLLKYCKPAVEPRHENRFEDCMAIARLLANADALLPRAIGLRIQFRLASDPSEIATLQQRLRDFRWQLAQSRFVGDLEFASELASQQDAWLTSGGLREAWLATGSEMGVIRVSLRNQGLPLSAPDDFEIDDRYFDPKR